VCDHRLDRYAISEMVCMLCGVRQPVAGEPCNSVLPILMYSGISCTAGCIVLLSVL
jgi:hypothetical protein